MKAAIYILTITPLLKGTAKVLENIINKGYRVHMLCSDQNEMKSLDTVLWTFSSLVFLPHGTDDDPEPESQPIYLSLGLENKNQANVLFVNHTLPDEAKQYERVVSVYVDEVNHEQIQRLKDSKADYMIFQETVNGWKEVKI